MLHVVKIGRSTVDDASAPPGHYVQLPGRGRTFYCERPGPERPRPERPGQEPSGGRGGDAPAVFLFHGLVVNGYLHYFPLFTPMGERYRIVCQDMRGHGRGIPLQTRFRLADCADDAVALADHLGIERFIAVGYSLGGPVAQLAWKRHPDRVAGLVLAATSRNFGGTAPERAFYSTLLAADVGIRLARRIPGLGYPIDPVEPTAPSVPPGTKMGRWALGELGLVSPHAGIQAMNAMGRFSSHEWIHEIDVPTAVVVTTQDRMIAADRQLRLVSAIPGATVHTAHAGHIAGVLGGGGFIDAMLDATASVAGRIAERDASAARPAHPIELEGASAWNA